MEYDSISAYYIQCITNYRVLDVIVITCDSYFHEEAYKWFTGHVIITEGITRIPSNAFSDWPTTSLLTLVSISYQLVTEHFHIVDRNSHIWKQCENN